MLLSNKVYDTLKWIAQYLLPATATLYFALSAIWGLPYGEQVVGTISALTIFLGVILGISTSSYYKSGADTDGVLQVDVTDPAKDIYRLQLNSELETLADKQRVIFKVDSDVKLSD